MTRAFEVNVWKTHQRSLILINILFLSQLVKLRILVRLHSNISTQLKTKKSVTHKLTYTYVMLIKREKFDEIKNEQALSTCTTFFYSSVKK